MQSPLLLFIGPSSTDERQLIAELFNGHSCIFAENGLRGLAAAIVRNPDVIICRYDADLIPGSFVKYEVRRVNCYCKFLTLDAKFA